MKALCVVMMILVWSQTVSAYEESDWRLVAKSPLIVKGVMKIPVEQFRKQQDVNSYNFLPIRVEVMEVYKGTATPGEITVKYQARGRSDAPEPEQLLSLDGKEAILFLEYNDWPDWKGIYFTSHPPNGALMAFSSQNEARVKGEIRRQYEQVSRLKKVRLSLKPHHGHIVKKLIDKMLNAETATEAYYRFITLGSDFVPAIIVQMNDYRTLPVQQFALGSSAVYRPKIVMDALTIILDEITGESFGRIYNGGSERERQVVLWGWSVWLAKRIATEKAEGNGKPQPK